MRIATLSPRRPLALLLACGLLGAATPAVAQADPSLTGIAMSAKDDGDKEKFKGDGRKNR